MNKLYRSRTNRMIAGVFGGLAEAYSVDANLLRLLYSVVAVFTGIVPFVMLYLIAAVLIPEASTVTTTTTPPS